VTVPIGFQCVVMDTALAIDEVLQRAANDRIELPSPPVRRAIRVAAGLPQEAVARAIEVSRATVTRYELGVREPRGDTRRRYAEALQRMRRV
jgi:DNA-binding XRE family transcriptional regulator